MASPADIEPPLVGSVLTFLPGGPAGAFALGASMRRWPAEAAAAPVGVDGAFAVGVAGAATLVQVLEAVTTAAS